MNKILVAVAPEAFEGVRSALENVAVLIPAYTIDDALKILSERVDMIIIGVYFDGSNMFELLGLVKNNRDFAKIPILCIRGHRAFSAIEPAIAHPMITNLNVVSTACETLGAVGFLDFHSLRLKDGVERAENTFTSVVRSHLAPGHL